MNDVELTIEEHDLAHTGVIVVDHGSRRSASNHMLEEFVCGFVGFSDFEIVEPAHMELAEPSIGTAFDRCVARGAKRVVVCPYFLLPGKHWDEDIPALVAGAAKRHPGVKYMVTAPIGLHPMMREVIASRIDYCLQHVDGGVNECESCQGTGRCKLQG
ncbi:CbiX/SirB N-terminal domain-containing protein [Poriferisphaera sp. WC338]|uniref:CbiX/SirB N-terminal domain-containing protein n=1 Tax=Poriferisphaera sp. WC338 TaxID=3425129 RepID=UPI003D8178A2